MELNEKLDKKYQSDKQAYEKLSKLKESKKKVEDQIKKHKRLKEDAERNKQRAIEDGDKTAEKNAEAAIKLAKEEIEKLAQALPIKRLAEPVEIAEFVWFLASEKNSFITGQTIFIDGGFSCV